MHHKPAVAAAVCCRVNGVIDENTLVWGQVGLPVNCGLSNILWCFMVQWVYKLWALSSCPAQLLA